MPDATPHPSADQTAADIAARPSDPAIARAVADLEPLGGDPPCWAHLFEDDDEALPGTGQSGEH